MKERGHARPALAGFVSGAVLTGLGLTGYLLVQGSPAVRIMGVVAFPSDSAGWWALAAVSASLGAAVGAVGAFVGWLLSHPRRRPPAPVARRHDSQAF